MNVLNGPYFRINKFLLTSTGLWPYLNLEKKLFRRIITNAVLISPTTSGLFEIWGNLDLMVESFIPVLTCIGSIVCSMTCIFKEKELKKLLDHIKSDWTLLSSEGDIAILENHSEDGRILTLVYTVTMSAACGMFVLTIVAPQIQDIILPLNETRPKRLASNMNYFFSWEKYFYYVVLHLIVISIVQVLVVTGCRSTFSVLTEHACGLFTNVGHKLQNIMQNISMDNSNNSNSRLEDTIYKDVTVCIERHQQAIEFTRIIDSLFSTCFFIIMGITVILLSTTLMQAAAHIGQFNEVIKFGAYSFGLIVDLYFNNLPAQRLSDCSSYHLSHQVFSGMWYQLPLKSRKLLIMIIMRTHFPCKLTVGKMFVMNMHNFATILHTSVSYFTLLSSMRS